MTDNQPRAQILDYARTDGPAPSRPEGAFLAAMMIFTAIAAGLAIYDFFGQYSDFAIRAILIALIACVLGVINPLRRPLKWFIIAPLLVIDLITEIYFALQGHAGVVMDQRLQNLLPLCGVMAVVALLPFKMLRHIAFAMFLIIFARLSFTTIATADRFSHKLQFSDGHYRTIIPRGEGAIDVRIFQEGGLDALMAGHDPYAMRFPNVYPIDTPFYGPGVVDSENRLTYGFPYPPLSLLMALPGWAMGDVRYSHVLALLGSAALMWWAVPRPISALAAALMLLTPTTLTLLHAGWTEPFLIFNFSLVMLCAVRFRRALPYALGLFFATKQYTVLAAPLVWLLMDEPNRRRQYVQTMLKAGAVAGAITLPFFLWNPHEFIRAVVKWQLVQPFREDALSFLVWVSKNHNGYHLPIWTPFLVVVPVIALALWRCPRSPAGFAAAITLVHLAFFAMNKQAFLNYYYFVIATACWVIVVAGGATIPLRTPQEGNSEIEPIHVQPAIGR